MTTLSSELLRIDPLTGCKNFLGFLEAGFNRSLSDISIKMYTSEFFDSYAINDEQYSAILFVKLNDLQFLNASKGITYGDSAIRWMGILLSEECQFPVYRLGGVEFAVFLKLEQRDAHLRLMERIHERVERESRLLGFPDSAADTALILFDHSPTRLDSILMQMGEAMVRVKNSPRSAPRIFCSGDFTISARSPQRWKPASDSDVSFSVRWLSQKSIFQVLEMGRTMDMLQQDAFTDAISGLPNMKAALVNIEQALQNAKTSGRPFSVLMIDGDNSRTYNNQINYAAGDQMIRDLSAVLRSRLRPDDFVARWRNGDEFLVILPNTTGDEARIVGERFRVAVKETSQAWRFPVTISIGIASCPTHGEEIDALIDQVEHANKRAKELGKDQVVMAGPTP